MGRRRRRSVLLARCFLLRLFVLAGENGVELGCALIFYPAGWSLISFSGVRWRLISYFGAWGGKKAFLTCTEPF